MYVPRWRKPRTEVGGASILGSLGAEQLETSGGGGCRWRSKWRALTDYYFCGPCWLALRACSYGLLLPAGPLGAHRHRHHPHAPPNVPIKRTCPYGLLLSRTMLCDVPGVPLWYTTSGEPASSQCLQQLPASRAGEGWRGRQGCRAGVGPSREQARILRWIHTKGIQRKSGARSAPGEISGSFY